MPFTKSGSVTIKLYRLSKYPDSYSLTEIRFVRSENKNILFMGPNILDRKIGIKGENTISKIR
jgi:hypothetical protein